jgi:hypothetical protein
MPLNLAQRGESNGICNNVLIKSTYKNQQWNSGINHNEMLDEVAKAEISLRSYGPEHFILISQSCWKEVVRAEKNWHRKVGCNETKKPPPKFNPTLTKHILRLKESDIRMATEAITGIRNFGKHLS